MNMNIVLECSTTRYAQPPPGVTAAVNNKSRNIAGRKAKRWSKMQVKTVLAPQNDLSAPTELLLARFFFAQDFAGSRRHEQ
jgi:hypothetical protein